MATVYEREIGLGDLAGAVSCVGGNVFNANDPKIGVLPLSSAEAPVGYPNKNNNNRK